MRHQLLYFHFFVVFLFTSFVVSHYDLQHSLIFRPGHPNQRRDIALSPHDTSSRLVSKDVSRRALLARAISEEEKLRALVASKAQALGSAQSRLDEFRFNSQVRLVPNEYRLGVRTREERISRATEELNASKHKLKQYIDKEYKARLGKIMRPSNPEREPLLGSPKSESHETESDEHNRQGKSTQKPGLGPLKESADSCGQESSPRVSVDDVRRQVVISMGSIPPREAQKYRQMLAKLLKNVPNLSLQLLKNAPTAPGDIIIAGGLAVGIYNAIHKNHQDAIISGACGVLAGHLCNMFMQCLKGALHKLLDKEKQPKAIQTRDLQGIPRYSPLEKRLEGEGQWYNSDAWLAVNRMGMEWHVPKLLDNNLIDYY
ncbi:hypothetical protein MMC10_005190 [Thelotrema lepadinum]|nr:hypothetical protein [Thelotrema lepadinum]